jgi:hypothetical protein
LLTLPALNRLLITLAGALYWHLHAPADRFEDAPDVVTMIADAKVAFDQQADTILGPGLAEEAMRLSPFGQQLRQLGTLSRAEAWRSSWRWTALEPINSPLSDTLHPLADSTLGDAKRLSNRLLAPALLLELPSAQTTAFTPVGWFIASPHQCPPIPNRMGSIPDFSALCRGQYKPRGTQRTDSLALFTKARLLTRIEFMVETVRVTLRAVVKADKEWAQADLPGEWEARYAKPCRSERLNKEEVAALSVQTGDDGQAAGRAGEWRSFR